MSDQHIGNSNQHLAVSGTVSAPAYSWASNNNSGFYRIGANNIGLTLNGAKVLDAATTGLTITGALAASNGISSTLVTDATSSSTGSIITAGGISTQKALWVGTTSNFAGTMTAAAATFSGNVTINGGAGFNTDNTICFRSANNNVFINGNSGSSGGLTLQGDGTGATSIVVNKGTGAIQFYVSSERARFDTSGNLLVGTTTSVGSLSNSAIMSAGRLQSFSGTATIPNGGSTVTVTTLSAGGTYLVGWEMNEAAGVGVWISGGSNLGPQQTVISSGNYFTGTLTVGFTVAGFGYSPSTSGNCVFTCGNSTGGSATLEYVFTRLR